MSMTSHTASLNWTLLDGSAGVVPHYLAVTQDYEDAKDQPE